MPSATICRDPPEDLAALRCFLRDLSGDFARRTKRSLQVFHQGALIFEHIRNRPLSEIAQHSLKMPRDLRSAFSLLRLRITSTLKVDAPVQEIDVSGYWIRLPLQL